MRASIAKTVSDLSKHAAMKARSPNTQVRAFSTLPTFTTHWQEMPHHHDVKEHTHSYTSNAHEEEQDFYDYSSFESTLDRVLEMTQLGKEHSVHWENVVRSAYKAEYHSDESVCHVCGGPKAVDVLCKQCVDSQSS